MLKESWQQHTCLKKNFVNPYMHAENSQSGKLQTRTRGP